MPPFDGLLFDMNGLFRHWHNTGARTSESLAGLPEGTIARYAYDHPTYRLARVGVLTDQQWADNVADRLAADFGPHVRDALGPWRADRGEPDDHMISLLAQIREHMPVGVLSNCTDALHADLQHHGIEFDHVFPSAELGVDKPSPEAYHIAARRMNISPHTLAYVDDEPTFIHAAQTVGIQARLFTGIADLTAHLHASALPLIIPPGRSSLADSTAPVPPLNCCSRRPHRPPDSSACPTAGRVDRSSRSRAAGTPDTRTARGSPARSNLRPTAV
ncbi:HAD-IA family hydrolase [Streptomyces sp. NPDC087843]|uniref:HAD-IA family hydrolase n=1 Tax=Streptomyces sp. NPDC087843 TaxID=3365804 RepID=UPI0038155833